MKTKILLIFCFFSITLFSQNKQVIELENMDLPTTPATTLLDQNITSIENPKTIKEFGLSVINSFKDNGLPQNFAVELNPYWIFKRSKDITQYLKEERHSGLKHNSSISFAFIKNDSVQNASIGIRGNLFRIMGKKYDNIVDNDLPVKIKDLYVFKEREVEQLLEQLRYEKDQIYKEYVDINYVTYAVFSIKYQSMRVLIQGSIIEKEDLTPIISKIDVLTKNESSFTINRTDIMKLYKDLQKEIDRCDYTKDKINTGKLKDFQKYIDNLTETKPIFSIDFASAYNHFFDKNSFSSGSFGRFGAWITMNYNASLNPLTEEEKDRKYLKLYVLNRYVIDKMQYNKDTNTYGKNTFYDVGGKIGFEFNKLSFAYEYIKRFGDFEDYRSVGSIMYKINNNVSLIGGFGKNFENQNNLFTTLGLRWGLNFNNKFSTEQN